MFRTQKKTIANGQSYKYNLFRQNKELRYIDFITLLEQKKAFRTFFINLLSEISFHAYRWETPPVTLSTTEQPFEFIIHNSPDIDLPPDATPFRSYFNNPDAGNSVAVFDNIGGDAKLIAPTPPMQSLNYSHIGVFTDEAPMKQQQRLWKSVGQTTQRMISDQPLWLNTAGGGVAWLHIRLDSRPKYYRHHPYRARE